MHYLLEEVGSVSVAEEWHRVGHHPYVSSSAVKVGFAPFAVLVGDAEDLVVEALRVRRLVGRVRVVSCKYRHNVRCFVSSVDGLLCAGCRRFALALKGHRCAA